MSKGRSIVAGPGKRLFWSELIYLRVGSTCVFATNGKPEIVVTNQQGANSGYYRGGQNLVKPALLCNVTEKPFELFGLDFKATGCHWSMDTRAGVLSLCVSQLYWVWYPCAKPMKQIGPLLRSFAFPVSVVTVLVEIASSDTFAKTFGFDDAER